MPVSIHWESRGKSNGPAVVLVQGLGLSFRFWFDQLLFSAPIQRKIRAAARRALRLLLPERETDRAHLVLAHWPSALAHDPLSMHTFARHALAVLANWSGPRRGRIEHPTFVIHGAEDILVLSRGQLRMMPGVAHDILDLAPNALVDALRELGELR